MDSTKPRVCEFVRRTWEAVRDYTVQPKGNRPPFGVVLVIWRGE